MVTYNDLTSIKKVAFENGVTLDLFPVAQEIMYIHRQTSDCSPEAGGLLLGYENSNTGEFTVVKATEPQETDIRSRLSLYLGQGHRKIVNQLEAPYGYIGTWHTHPSEIPSPSSVDLRDWEVCIEQNCKSTSALVFIIVGTSVLRIWLCDSLSGILYEGNAV